MLIKTSIYWQIHCVTAFQKENNYWHGEYKIPWKTYRYWKTANKTALLRILKVSKQQLKKSLHEENYDSIRRFYTKCWSTAIGYFNRSTIKLQDWSKCYTRKRKGVINYH